MVRNLSSLLEIRDGILGFSQNSSLSDRLCSRDTECRWTATAVTVGVRGHRNVVSRMKEGGTPAPSDDRKGGWAIDEPWCTKNTLSQTDMLSLSGINYIQSGPRSGR